MNALIPIEYYSRLFFYVTFIGVLIAYFKLRGSNNLFRSSLIHYLLVYALILYLGFRPVSVFFGDMGSYAMIFESYKNGYDGIYQQDWGFEWFMKNTARFLPLDLFFLLVAFIYVFAHYLASKRLFKDNWHYAFLILISSFSFWSYGTNGIRNGMAAALILLAFSFEKNKPIALALALVAASFHQTMLLPLAAYGLTFINNNSKYYLWLWFVCIPLSLAAGGLFEFFFAGLGFNDSRLSYLTDGNVNDDDFASTGFRWDFLLYSASAVFSGYYFIIKKQFQDVWYQRLLNVYLISNGFWILVIRANFSNRFAYLSWFMMGLVIVYPFLKGDFIKDQPRILGMVILIYFLFTFLLNVILA